jgi:hypothetical protein
LEKIFPKKPKRNSLGLVKIVEGLSMLMTWRRMLDFIFHGDALGKLISATRVPHAISIGGEIG